MQKERTSLYNDNFSENRDLLMIPEVNSEKLAISENFLQKWQKCVNILAQIINVPSALIIKIDSQYLEVFRSNSSSTNPYKIGDRVHWDNHYCKHVITTRKMLIVPNALKDRKWDRNPDIELGMISYIGLPLLWPNGKVFGTICVLDNKENHYSSLYIALITQFRELSEAYLKLIWEKHKIGIILDTQEKIEYKLFQKEKYAILGQLTSALGHELSNPLTSIKNAAYLLTLILENPTMEIRENLEVLEKEVETSETIINNFLEYTQPKPMKTSRININDFLKKIILQFGIPKNIELATQLDADIPSLIADPEKLALILRNIILNAIYAITDHGQLIIRTGNEKTNWVTISITDTGIGIAKKNLAMLYRPLFTTKSKGIGLGLAVVKNLVKAHEGSIEVKSELGKGSTFIIKLPSEKKEGK